MSQGSAMTPPVSRVTDAMSSPRPRELSSRRIRSAGVGGSCGWPACGRRAALTGGWSLAGNAGLARLPGAQDQEGEHARGEHQERREVEGGVQPGVERAVRGADDLLDEGALAGPGCPAGPIGVAAGWDAAGLDRVDHDRLEIGRDAQVLQP